MRRGWIYVVMAAAALGGCIGGSNGAGSTAPVMPPVNTLNVTVDAGPAAASGAVNHAYVSVKLCAPGTATCTTVDHVLLDTGSWGLRVVRSVLTAGAVTLAAETDSQGRTIEECASFASGQTWGPVAAADVTLAGETATKVPVQILDDSSTGDAAPAGCGSNGSLLNGVADWSANGVLGLGVFGADCGPDCVAAATPLAMYYVCTTAGACTAANVALDAQVTNPATRFAADNNGFVLTMPNLQNADGDSTVHGQLTFGLNTQPDNQLPATLLTVLAADSHGDFLATYGGGTTALPALIDSGTEAYLFDDPTIAICTSAAWVGYYCPAIAPLATSAVNMSAATTTAVVPASTNRVAFAVADPNTFVAGASAFAELAAGAGSTHFFWGMPFFYGRTIYIGFDGKTAGSFTGPYYAY